MKAALQTLRAFVQREPAGFTSRLIKNSATYVVQKYVYRNEFATQQIHGYKMKLSLRDPGISRTLFLINDREREHAYLLQHITRTGDTVLDLGANIGYYALMEAGLVGDAGRVIAVEPHPANFSLLTENIALNQRRTITPIHAAVTNEDGSATLHVSKLSNVHSVLPSVNYSAAQAIEVPSISLATLASQYPNIGVIRMDIEGFETVILESIVQINKSKRFTPSILFELHAKKYTEGSMTQLLEKLAGIGYAVRYLATSNSNLIRSLDLPILTSIPTDGKIRHIVENVSVAHATTLIPTARCLVLSA